MPLFAQVPAEIELEETKLALAQAKTKIEELSKALVAAEAIHSELAPSLAASNAEAGEFKDSYQKLKLHTEGLGKTLLEENKIKSLEARLIQSISDMGLLKSENDALRLLLSAQLVSTQSLLPLIPAAQHKDVITTTEAESAKAAAFLSQAQKPVPAENPTSITLQESQVVSTKEEHRLAVLNVGSKQGVKIGMPFQIFRVDKPLGSAIAVDVRESICGAVYQDPTGSNPIKVGDIAKVDAGQ